jgi:fermentation-respiration switch protein FrsA (DUF1100 family)
MGFCGRTGGQRQHALARQILILVSIDRYMIARLSAIFLAMSSWALAETPAPSQLLPENLRAVLDDPNGDLAQAAKGILGPKGGNQLFYFPTRDQPATPATWGFKFENIDFKSADGTPLHGWFIPARGGKCKATVVFSHGNAGSIGHHLGFVTWLAEAGYNVLMYDYRGFGKSGGNVDRRGMINDVKAAFSYAGRRADVDSKRLVSYGHSLGGAKSVTALGEAPVKGLRAVVIDGAFASYQTMAKVMGGQLGASLVSDELAPKDFVQKLSPVPLLVVHGTRDEVVPVSQGRQLYENARQPKTLFEVKTGRHGDSLSRDNGAFRKRMLVWLDEQMDG